MVHLIVAITGAHRAPDLPLAAAVALWPSSAHPHTPGLNLSASDGIWNMLFSTCPHTSRWVRFRFGGCLSLVVAHVRPTHHSPFRVLRTSLMPSQPGFVSASPLGSTSTAVCCASLTSNSSPPEIGRAVSSQLAAIMEARGDLQPPHIARERKLLQLRVIHLCARFGISQDRIWNPDERTQIVYEKKTDRVRPHGPIFPHQLVSHTWT